MTTSERSSTEDPDAASATSLSEELLAYFRETPFAYAGFRILHIHTLRGEDSIAERDEVPLIGSVAFPLVFGLYLFARRFAFLIARFAGHAPEESLPADGHLFTMTSTHEFRTQAFVNIAAELQSRGHEVTLLCSPSGAAQRTEWEERGLSTATFDELLGRVRVSRLLGIVRKAIKARHRLDELGPYDTAAAPFALVVNVIILEQVKRECIREITLNEPSIHTYSPMPYLLESTGSDKVYVYQHGIQWHRDERQAFDFSVPSFIPLTYFVWGDPWVSNFEEYAHPEARVLPVGSPWYDQLSKRETGVETEPSYDVVFVSKSPQSDSVPDKHLRYEALFEAVLDICNKKDLSLAVKLHPNEPPDWYRERGWEKYIVEFEGIEEALQATRLAVTDNSSTFVESAALGTPMIVADIADVGLDALGPVSNTIFADDLDDLQEGILGVCVEDREFARIQRGRQLVRLGDSTERIADEVTVERGE